LYNFKHDLPANRRFPNQLINHQLTIEIFYRQFKSQTLLLYRTMTTIKVGDTMPNGSFGIMTKDGPGSMSTEELFSGKKVALFSKSDSHDMVLRGVRLAALNGSG
jgi:hypothetical protein